MKKRFLFAALALVSWSLNAQVLDQPVATVKLTKTEIISQKEFKEKVALVEQATNKTLGTAEKTELLNELVANVLILQAAEKAGIKVGEAEVIAAAKAQLNAKMPDEEFKKAVEKQTGAPWAKFADNARKQLIAQKFIMQNPKSAELEKVTVTDSEIAAFFEENKAQFISPEMARISHIFFDTKKNPKGTLEQIRQRADDTQKLLSSGKATFEEMARKESDDKNTAGSGGDLGFIPRGTSSPASQQIAQLFGKEFIASVFGLKKGEVSKVLTSNLGLHIVRVTEKMDQKFLQLNDQINPMQSTTVKELIRNQLTGKNQQEALSKLLNDIVDELKKQADIKTYPKNI